MNREILFRVWDGESLISEIDLMNITEGVLKALPDDSVIMQYVGFNDINGVEIYEGDIVRYKSGTARPVQVIHKGKELTAYEPIYETSVVVFYHGCFGLHYSPDVKHHELNSKYSGVAYSGNINNHRHGLEIIGNVFENHELVKECKGYEKEKEGV